MLKQVRKWLTCAVCCIALLAALSSAAFATSHDISEDEGQETTVGEAGGIVDEDGHANTETEFYLRIENPSAPSEPGKVHTSHGRMPKTGDSGVRIETLLIAALVFGSGYLLCSQYGKKVD